MVEMSMRLCVALSLGPVGGGAHYFGRTGSSSTGAAHSCELETGHEGPHAKRAVSPLCDGVAMVTTYSWSDEQELRATVGYVIDHARNDGR